MKCICGYEYEFDYGTNRVIKGDEEFIQSDTIIKYGKCYSTEERNIIICPKCKTLKIDI